MTKIILTGGGTAGHCIPNLALLPYLKKHFNNIYYIGSYEGMERKIIESENIPYYPITTTKFKRGFAFDNIFIPIKLSKAIIQAKKIIREIKPDVIFSKGGYVSLPVVIAGYKCNVPVISHESDLTVGLANKIASKYCKKVLTSFPETAKTLKNGLYSGAPIRSEFFNINKENALKSFGFSGDKPILVITGGSQGSNSINQTVRSCLSQLLNKFDIIHICGKGNLQLSKVQKGYYQVEYLNNIHDALGIADIVISRAGSNTIFEILALKKPNVLIPLPKGISRGDQVLNAHYFSKKGLSTVIEQDNLTRHSLLNAINSTYNYRNSFLTQITNHPINDASKNIVNIIIDSF